MEDEIPTIPLSMDEPEEPREEGHVKWFNDVRNYGFIKREDGSDLFVHASSINRDPPTLNENDKVEFTVAPGEKGPEARDVIVLLEAPK